MLKLNFPIEIGESTDHSRSVTNEYYQPLVLTIRSIRGEPSLDIDPVTMLSIAAEAIFFRLISHAPWGAKLYWRVRPEISQGVDDGGHAVIHTFYCRFLISNQPEIYSGVGGQIAQLGIPYA